MKRLICALMAALLLLSALPAMAAGWEPGDTFTLGKWSMSGDKEPIRWTVIHVVEKGVFMLAMADEPVAYFPYHNEEGVKSWEHSSLRAWLNGDFKQGAFTQKEQKLLQRLMVENTPFTDDPDAGKDTLDYVYVLSSGEVGVYLPDADLSIGTDWWLRDHGTDGAHSVYVDAEGLIVLEGAPLTEYKAVRPVIILMTSAIKK